MGLRPPGPGGGHRWGDHGGVLVRHRAQEAVGETSGRVCKMECVWIGETVGKRVENESMQVTPWPPVAVIATEFQPKN